jgi:pyrroloquinoline quinone (PQQ) biosynthesis protein C
MPDAPPNATAHRLSLTTNPRDNRSVTTATDPATSATDRIAAIATRISPLRARLNAHPLYASIRTPEHLRLFMQSHVFAVWDFMSLLKSLQSQLTCTTVPWSPTPFPASRRFINEIVLGEESDLFEGRTISHFELYLEAMQQAHADTTPIRALLFSVALGSFLPSTFEAPPAARAFVASTFRIIYTGNLAAVAAAFTFGREDVIPDIFRNLVRDLNTEHAGELSKFVWYLERHIEVDGEDHGPLSLRMVADLCGDDDARWEQATRAAESAIEARLALWDGILAQIDLQD